MTGGGRRDRELLAEKQSSLARLGIVRQQLIPPSCRGMSQPEQPHLHSSKPLNAAELTSPTAACFMYAAPLNPHCNHYSKIFASKIRLLVVQKTSVHMTGEFPSIAVVRPVPRKPCSVLVFGVLFLGLCCFGDGWVRAQRLGPWRNAGDGHYPVADGRRRGRDARHCTARSAGSPARRRLGQLRRKRVPGPEPCAVRQHPLRLQQAHLHLMSAKRLSVDHRLAVFSSVRKSCWCMGPFFPRSRYPSGGLSLFMYTLFS